MKRDLKGLWSQIFFWVAFAFACFQLYTAGFGFLPSLQQRAIHIVFGLSLALLSYSYKKKAKAETKVPIWDIILIGIVLAANINIFLLYEQVFLLPGVTTIRDLILGALLILVIIEISRRTIGLAIPIILGLGLIYLFVSPYLSGVWQFRGLSLETVINSIYYSGNGIYGSITGISATLVAVFIIFGSLLVSTGSGETFINLANKIAGRFRGGPAKVAVIGSAMFGMISGSAVANAAVIGNYTIPLMKRLGYKAEFAAGVEATASTGGMITPPVLGIAAFVMAEMLGMSYLKIIVYAIIPCVLYYTALFSGVHFEALRLKLPPVPKEEIPSWRAILTWPKMGPFLIPILILMGLLAAGFDIVTAGFYASVAIVVLFLFADLRFSQFKKRIIEIGKALSKGGQALIDLVPLLVVVNVLVNILSISGVMIKFSQLVINVGGTNLVGSLLLAALVPLVLGMGIVPVAVYVLSAAVIAPALLTLGLELMPVHMFIFYISCLAPITPPVCAAVYVTATMAKANWVKVSFIACRLAIIIFIIPFFFVLKPTLLMVGPPLEILFDFITAACGAVMLSSGLFGFLTRSTGYITRLMFIIGGLLLLWPSAISSLYGAVLFVVAFGIHYLSHRFGSSNSILAFLARSRIF